MSYIYKDIEFDSFEDCSIFKDIEKYVNEGMTHLMFPCWVHDDFFQKSLFHLVRLLNNDFCLYIKYRENSSMGQIFPEYYQRTKFPETRSALWLNFPKEKNIPFPSNIWPHDTIIASQKRLVVVDFENDENDFEEISVETMGSLLNNFPNVLISWFRVEAE